MGIAHIVDPDRFIKGSGVRQGGEMLTEFNRIGFQIVGIVVAVFSACLIYMLVGDILAR
jgi:hypothetical protein